MRTITILIIVICLAGAACLQAQTEKGHWLIGASSRTSAGFNWLPVPGSEPSIMNLGFSTFKNKDDSGEEYDPEKFTSINLSPQAGYFVIDNLVVGLDMNLAFMKYSETVDYASSVKTTFFTAGPFVRYYIPAGKVYPFFEAGAAFGVQNDTYDESGEYADDDTESYSVKCYGGGAGLAVPLGKKATFDTMLTYNSLSTKAKEDNSDNFRTILGTFGIKFGFHFYLGN